MTSRTLHFPAPWRAVIEAHLRAVGIGLRPTLVFAGTLLLALEAIAGLAALRDGEEIAFVPEFALLVALAALLFPTAVWRGEYHVQRSYLASLPVGRAKHTLLKLAAGWAWLLALTGVFMLAMLGLAVVTGGAVGVDEMRVMARDLPAGVAPGEAAAYARRWTTPGWQWAVFCTTATVAYLLGSTIVLAGRRARRWLVGVVVLILFCALLAEQGYSFGGVEVWVVEGAQAIVLGPYGLVALFGAPVSRTLTDGGPSIWREVTLMQWALTTVLWIGFALVPVLLVVGRDRRS